MKQSTTKLILLAFFALINFQAFAQTPTDPPAEPEAPIDTYLLTLAIVAIVLSFVFLTKRFKKVA